MAAGMMDPWLAKLVVVISSIVMVAIRAPHGQRSRGVKVVRSRKGPQEFVLLTVAWLAFFVPFVWVAAPMLAFADYPLLSAPFFAGVVCLSLGLWLFARSHADLGRNWSITLEVRQQHQLVTHGVYRSIRHPMYSALLLYSLGQALVLPNWIAGPSYAAAMLLLVAVRLGPEERMMLEEFGEDYATYVKTSKRLVPGVW